MTTISEVFSDPAKIYALSTYYDIIQDIKENVIGAAFQKKNFDIVDMTFTFDDDDQSLIIDFNTEERWCGESDYGDETIEIPYAILATNNAVEFIKLNLKRSDINDSLEEVMSEREKILKRSNRIKAEITELDNLELKLFNLKKDLDEQQKKLHENDNLSTEIVKKRNDIDKQIESFSQQ